MALPSPRRPQTPDDHAAISRRFIDHARRELDNGDRLQASEKVWGAAAHSLKAIAMQRGWHHHEHETMFDIAVQLAREFDRPEFSNWMNTANSMHGNFYANRRDADSIRFAIDAVEDFVAALDEVRSLPPQPFTVETESDRERLETLLGMAVRIGDHSDDGFTPSSLPPGRRRRRRRRRRQPPEDT